MIRAVVFDLDGTLLDRDASIVQFARSQYRQREVLQRVPEVDYVRSFVALDDGGHVWKDEVYRQLIARYGIEGVTWEVLLQDYIEGFANFAVGFPGLQEVLGTLRAEGYLLGMITNGRSPFQERAIQALDIQDYFSTILVSEAVGMRKPEPEIFMEALRQLSVQASDAVFIGDNPTSDIRGAQGVGMKVIWQVSSRWAACDDADAVCRELSELPDIIQQL